MKEFKIQSNRKSKQNNKIWQNDRRVQKYETQLLPKMVQIPLMEEFNLLKRNAEISHGKRTGSVIENKTARCHCDRLARGQRSSHSI